MLGHVTVHQDVTERKMGMNGREINNERRPIMESAAVYQKDSRFTGQCDL